MWVRAPPEWQRPEDAEEGGTYMLLETDVPGLAGASRAFFLTVKRVFTQELKLVQSKVDPCLFWMVRGKNELLKAVYIDFLQWVQQMTSEASNQSQSPSATTAETVNSKDPNTSVITSSPNSKPREHHNDGDHGDDGNDGIRERDDPQNESMELEEDS